MDTSDVVMTVDIAALTLHLPNAVYDTTKPRKT